LLNCGFHIELDIYAFRELLEGDGSEKKMLAGPFDVVPVVDAWKQDPHVSDPTSERSMSKDLIPGA
jgi:hypothetical protein